MCAHTSNAVLPDQRLTNDCFKYKKFHLDSVFVAIQGDNAQSDVSQLQAYHGLGRYKKNTTEIM